MKITLKQKFPDEHLDCKTEKETNTIATTLSSI